ncbi:DUF6080 domain-containing protein [Paenibacillus sp. FA6]|uniref:DUF6080 domain-containing protein n=1 Tax=Paenibacillus sp. FA6 TaxID=3413029 RepID=UPI003F656CA1
MKQNIADLAGYSPFYGAPFVFNIFNFDPSMYYGSGNSSIIHPLMNFLSGPLLYFSKFLFGNLFFLVIQSVINALSVIMIYYYLRKSGSDNVLAVLFAAFFGVSSYNIFTAMIPDSYSYVQFIIILSVLYLQYSRVLAKTNVLPNASFALVNFAATSTNIVPFIGALFFNMIDKRDNKTIKKFISILLTFLLLVVLFTLLQSVLFGGNTWINNWITGLNNGGFSYAAPFSFSQHWKAIYMLVISPILSPDMMLVDQGIMAFVTDLTRPYPFYVTIIGFTLIILAGLGFIKGIKSRETWTLVPYIFFAILLHIIVGFGLAVFKFDLYLYAGHYLFAFFLLAARFIMQINHDFIKKGLIAIILIFVLTTLGNNVIKHIETLNYIEDTYSGLNNTGAVK